ncbi:MAG: Pre-mRNA-splicing factor cwc26 [Sclerophora amabilis]|nr:MAG: Pre-mRNA-splicing factor cwc26 [Sclerophora amabilis]
MSLADYLAKNYLTADPVPDKKSKKRKRKGTQPGSAGLVIADDDALGWNDKSAGKDEDDGPLTVSGQTSEFRRAKKSAWQTIGAPAPSSSDQAAADAIIASAAAESAARGAADGGDDDDPTFVENDKSSKHAASAAQMESGAHAGLQSAEQVTSALKRRQAEERARFETEGDEYSGRNKETIYRDASGRIINVAMKRAEARRQAEEEAAKQAAELEAQKGAVQQAQRSQRQQQLQDAKYLPVSRFADDAELNEEMRQRDRWNDPAAQFLTAKKSGKSVTGKPLYTGPFTPNRYGIRPGYRWDGVDRGTGFEKEYFAAQNRRKNVRDLEYAWQMDE